MQPNDYIQILKRRKVVILLAIIVTTITAYYASKAQPPLYGTSAVISVSPNSSMSMMQNVANIGKQGVADAVVQLEAMRASNLSNAEIVVKRLHLKSTPQELLAMVTISERGDISAIMVSAVDNNPKMTAKIANEFAKVVVEESRKNATYNLDRTLNILEKRLEQKRSEVKELGQIIDNSKNPATSLGQALTQNTGISAETLAEWNMLTGSYSWITQKVDELTIARDEIIAPLRLVEEARIPTAPFKPETTKNTLVGLAVGMMLGLGIALVQEYADSTLKSEEDLEKYLGASMLGSITAQKTRGPKKNPFWLSASKDSEETESYRKLAVNLQHLAQKEIKSRVKTIMFTNTMTKNGKPEVLANLAVTLARAGNQVLLVCANLRSPNLQKYFISSEMQGLFEVLEQGMNVEQAIIQTDIPNLQIIVSGNVEKSLTSPADLLATVRLDEVLKAFRAKADIVLLDSPSIVEVADATILAQKVDAIIIVASLGEITRALIEKVHRFMEQTKTPILGFVAYNKRAKKLDS